MKILVTGCIHGRFDRVVQLARELLPDLCILLGDLQAFPDAEDMKTAHLKAKYEKIGDFPRLASGELRIDCPVIAIAGNHEGAFLNAFRYGGFLATNVYFVGEAAQLKFIRAGREIDIAAVSGISNDFDEQRIPLELRVRHQRMPQDDNDPAVKHVQSCSVNSSLRTTHCARADLNQIQPKLQSPTLCLTHDWPLGVLHLIPPEKKNQGSQQLDNATVGGPVSAMLLSRMQNQQSVLACAHMHYYIRHFIPMRPEAAAETATVNWKGEPDSKRCLFLALNKVERDGGYEVIEFADHKATLDVGQYSQQNSTLFVWNPEGDCYEFAGAFDTPVQIGNNQLILRDQQTRLVNKNARKAVELK